MKNESNFNVRRISRVFLLFCIVCLCSIRINGQTYTTTTKGTHDGWYFDLWNENTQGTVSMTMGPAGNYTTTWTNVSNFTAGKGWKIGKPDRSICFDATFNGGNNGYLAVYGWTRNELVEYYVIENHGIWNPPGNSADTQYMGSFVCDGGTYKIYKVHKATQLTLFGLSSFYQFFSIRTQPRSSGTVTFSKHVEEWEKYGMNLGTTWEYQLLITEGYQSSGNSNVTIFECESSPITVTIAQPTSPVTLSAPAVIPIEVTASSLNGSIEKVEFYNGTTKLGEDTAAPFIFSWENVPAGTYSVTAVAIDNTGASLTSVSQQYIVGNATDPIELKMGWNIIGCPYAGSIPIEMALQDIWDKVESVKDFDAYYLKSNPAHLNTLTCPKIGLHKKCKNGTKKKSKFSIKVWSRFV